MAFSKSLHKCSKMDITKLSRERILLELQKALLKSSRPSIFFEYLNKMNQLSYWFKEIQELISIPQPPKFHKEGNVYIHTMMVLDECAKYRDKTSNPYGFMLSALTHDFGKIVCTKDYDEDLRVQNR